MNFIMLKHHPRLDSSAAPSAATAIEPFFPFLARLLMPSNKKSEENNNVKCLTKSTRRASCSILFLSLHPFSQRTIKHCTE